MAALPNIVDGFTLNTGLLYLPNRFFPNALAQLDILRRANNLRPRWFTVPQESDQPIQPYDTLQYQIDLNPGSYVWALNFTELGRDSGSYDLSVQITDSCTEITFFSDFKNANGLHSNNAVGLFPVLCTQPRIILEPGRLNVEIANQGGSARTCQLLIHAAEPCMLIDEPNIRCAAK